LSSLKQSKASFHVIAYVTFYFSSDLKALVLRPNNYVRRGFKVSRWNVFKFLNLFMFLINWARPAKGWRDLLASHPGLSKAGGWACESQVCGLFYFWLFVLFDF
jgi:hypothetical protein